MKVVKRVFFDAPGEKEKLNELTKKHKDFHSLAFAIESNFGIDFNDSLFIAEYWLNLINEKK